MGKEREKTSRLFLGLLKEKGLPPHQGSEKESKKKGTLISEFSTGKKRKKSFHIVGRGEICPPFTNGKEGRSGKGKTQVPRSTPYSVQERRR